MLMMVIGGNDHSDHFQKQTWPALPLDSLPQRGGAVRPHGAQDAHPGEQLILGFFLWEMKMMVLVVLVIDYKY